MNKFKIIKKVLSYFRVKYFKIYYNSVRMKYDILFLLPPREETEGNVTLDFVH